MRKYGHAIGAGLLGLALVVPVAVTADAAPARTPSTPASSTVASRPIELTADAPAPALAKPKGFKISFKEDSIYMSWKKVSKAKKYGVYVVSTTFIGPPQPHWTKARHISVPYTSINGDSSKSLIFGLSAWAAHSNSGITKKAKLPGSQLLFKLPAPIKKTSDGKLTKKSKSGIKKLAKKCIKQAGAMTAATAVAGGGVMAVAIWIPAVGEITAAGVAAAAGGAGTAQGIYCAIMKG